MLVSRDTPALRPGTPGPAPSSSTHQHAYDPGSPVTRGPPPFPQINDSIIFNPFNSPFPSQINDLNEEVAMAAADLAESTRLVGDLGWQAASLDKAVGELEKQVRAGPAAPPLLSYGACRDAAFPRVL